MIAHLRKGDNTAQSVKDHCTNVASLAAKFGKPVGLEHSCYLTGLLHDLGKCTNAFEVYIRSGGKGSVYHSPQGTIFVYEHWYLRKDATLIQKQTAQIISMVIRGHHGGLLDCLKPDDGNSPYYSSLSQEKEPLFYKEAVGNFISKCAPLDELEKLFELSCKEIEIFIQNAPSKNPLFMLGLVAKFVLSCIVDADRWDSACFEENVDPFQEEQSTDWDGLLSNLNRFIEAMQSGLTAQEKNRPINKLRREISESCLSRGDLPRGCYRLSVPTGGGKTLSSLRFALSHVKNTHELSRIFYVIPYNTILEQNGQDIKDALGCDDLILEHYGVFISENTDEKEGEKEEALHTGLAERWNVPIILTSMVQFLNAAFKGKNTNTRRFHRLANSVIVFDEIQALPTKCTKLFERLIKFLTDQLHCTVLLCTATQPEFNSIDPKPLLQKELMEKSPTELKRVDFIAPLEEFTYSQASKRLCELMEKHGSALMIVNTKEAAREIFTMVSENLDDKILKIHLTTALCPQHRLNQLDSMKKALKTPGQRVLCVATMLIEAGVNLSFPCVVRSFAGLPSILQAAGRCNRNMELENKYGAVYVWKLTQERLSFLPEIAKGQRCTLPLIDDFSRISAENTIHNYFENEGNCSSDIERGYPYNDSSLFKLLGSNKAVKEGSLFCRKNPSALALFQSFETAGKEFEVIGKDTVQVLTPFGEGERIIEKLNSTPNLYEKIKFLREAQRYSVTVYKSTLERLKKEGAVWQALDTEVYILKPQWYDSTHFGLLQEAAPMEFMSF